MIQRVPWPYRIGVMAIIAVALIVCDVVMRDDRFTSGVELSTGPSIEQFVDDDLLQATVEDDTPYFGTTVEVRPDHSVVVTERIGEFFALPQRGIFRDVPLIDGDGTVRRVRSVTVRTTAGTPNVVKLESFDTGLRIRIGNPDRRIIGPHGYEITYVIENAMSLSLADPETAEFRFATVQNWGRPITRLEYRVRGPEGTALRSCRYRSDICPDVAVTTTDVVITLPDRRHPEGALRFSVGYPRRAFEEFARTTTPSAVSPIIISVTAVALVAILIGYLIHDWRRRRSRRLVAGSIDATFSVTDALVDRHPGLHQLSEQLAAERAVTSFPEIPPIEFVPPLGLDPAQVLRLTGRGSSGRLMAATLLDLAADGVIDLIPEGKSFRVSRRAQEPRAVTAYELVLLQHAVGDETSQLLSERSKQLTSALAPYLAALDESLRQRGLGRRFSSRDEPWSPRGSQMLVATFIGFFATPIVYYSHSTEQPSMIWWAPAVAATIAVFWGALDQRMAVSGLSPLGRAAAYRVVGFQRFFTESEGRQARFAEQRGMLREYMGYALVFDSLREWVRLAPRMELPDDWQQLDLMRFTRLTEEKGFQSPRESSGGSSGFTGGGGSGGGSISIGGGGGGRW